LQDRRIFGFIGFLIVTLAAAQAQELTLEEILKRNEDAIGGAVAIDGIQTLKLTAHSVMAGSKKGFSMVVMTKRPNLVRMEMTVQGNEVIMGYDGVTAWRVTGSGEPEKLDQASASRLKDTSMNTSIGALTSLRAAGHQLELLGKEDAAGGPAYKVKVTMKDGMTAVYYLDAKTFLPVRTIATVSTAGKDMEVESYPTDYRRVGGIMFAHSIDQRVGGSSIGKLTYEKIEVNEPMEDKIFQMPGGSDDIAFTKNLDHKA